MPGSGKCCSMPSPKHVNRELHRKIAERVRQARRGRGLSQEQLAERIGVQPETVSRYETGSVPLSLTMLYRVSDALDVPVDSLLVVDQGRGLDDRELRRCWTLLDDATREAIMQLLRRLTE